MNSAMSAVAAQARNQFASGPMTHSQTVTRLYRTSLRLAFSWCIDREVFLNKAEEIRREFDAVKGRASDGNVLAAIQHCQDELLKYAHPDPYVIPWAPGGSKFMRNPPPPPDVVHVGEHGHHENDELKGTNTPVWPDMVSVEFRPRSQVTGYLIDFSTKTMQ
jgi:NADH dehydrogenase (ubiquinone) 1 beta subcomplex subunit 9